MVDRATTTRLPCRAMSIQAPSGTPDATSYFDPLAPEHIEGRQVVITLDNCRGLFWTSRRT